MKVGLAPCDRVVRFGYCGKVEKTALRRRMIMRVLVAFVEINLALYDTIREFSAWHSGNIIVDAGRLEVVDIDTAVVPCYRSPFVIIIVIIDVTVMPLSSCSCPWGGHARLRKTAAFSA